MEKKHRLLLVGLFVSLIIFGVILLYSQGEDVFKNKVVIKYNTGCNETYIKGKLITPECDKAPQSRTNFEGLNWNVSVIK